MIFMQRSMKEGALCIGLLLLVVASDGAADWHKAEEPLMGTRVTVELWHEDPKIAKQGIKAVMDEMHRINRLMSPYIEDSELSKINREAASRPVVCDPELLQLIARSLEISKITDGAFDITFASVGHLYNYREGVHPDDDQIKSVLPAISYRHVHLDLESGSIKFARAGVKIDLGGIAKGYAVDRGIAILDQMGVEHAIVTAGGDSRVRGERWGRPWKVGIREPRDPDAVVAILPLIDTAISTSGDYERFFIEEGVRYHHILNPGTGRSVDTVRSVSVIGPDATTTDALSTSVFVLGTEKGLTLVDSLAEFEAVIIDEHGQMLFSNGLKRLNASATR